MTRTYNINIKKDRPKTWTKKRISIIIIVSITYGIWFNFLDSAAFCNPSENRLNCTPIGQALGTNYIYQPWNIIGHCVPGLFMLLFSPRRIELFIAGILISSAVMDSPLWGVMKLNFHNLPLWHMEGNNLYAVTWHLSDWIVYYYNPIGSYQVWKEHWLHVGLP
ncbi:MAG TPA: hypothetical protein VFI70_07515, partial [Nitrososphaeraceae archaeon]|nr:hypothetical protein [Nitrososphaeraceae archaeon]